MTRPPPPSLRLTPRFSTIPATLLIFGFCAAGTSGFLLAQEPSASIGAATSTQSSPLPVDHVRRLTSELERLRGDVETGPAEFTPPELRMEWYQRHVEMLDSSPYKELGWQFLGPKNISGRVTDVAVVEPRGRSYTIFAAAASGGVWRTKNDGVTWEPVFQHGASTSIGDVTIAPSNPSVVWVGTGESNIFRSSMAGAGVFKSTDGGDTWQHMGLSGTHTIARIVIHPTNPDVLYVAASGHEWTNNEDRGVYRSKDGGQTWEKVLYVDEKTGAIDLVMHPTITTTLYAATWQRIRKKWNDPRNEVGYYGSSIYKSEDGGNTWKEKAGGLPPAEHRGRIGIDLCRAQPNVLYAFIDNYATDPSEPTDDTDSYGRRRPRSAILGATLFRSDDGAESWRQVSAEDDYMRRLSATYGWVFGQVRADPVNPDKVYVMGLALNVSEDSGKTFKALRGMHGDHHALWIDPTNPDFLVNGNDGGVVISYDGGNRWRRFTDNLPAVQFFNVGIDMAQPFHVYGSIQDHGSMRGVVDLSRGRDKIPAVDFEDAPGGEGCTHAVEPTDPNTVYSAGFYGRMQRTDIKEGKTVPIVPQASEGEAPYRGQWIAPFIISPHNPRILYLGLNHLFRAWDRGEKWERISPDLTSNDPRRLGDIPYQTIYSISESPHRFGLIYAGTDDGKVHVTHDGGKSWEPITSGLAANRWICEIVASKYDVATVYLTQNGKRNDDFTPYLWKSTDYGRTWTSIVANLPSGPVNVIKEDPRSADILYAGTDIGVYVSVDGAKSWSTLCAELPTTFVHDLAVHSRDLILVAATHGRGMWALDVTSLVPPPVDAAAAPAAAASTAIAETPVTK